MKIIPKFTLFSWFVSELKSNPNLDFYLLSRFTPELFSKTKLFAQVEFLSTFASIDLSKKSFTERLCLGLKFGFVQFGFGADLSQSTFINSNLFENYGIFLRYEFE